MHINSHKSHHRIQFEAFKYILRIWHTDNGKMSPTQLKSTPYQRKSANNERKNLFDKRNVEQG